MESIGGLNATLAAEVTAIVKVADGKLWSEVLAWCCPEDVDSYYLRFMLLSKCTLCRTID